MANLTNAFAGLVLFTVLVTLTITIYDDFQGVYKFDESDIKNVNGTTGNIMEQFKTLNIVEGAQQIQSGIVKLKNANIKNVFYGIESIGIGVLKTLTGVVVFPFQITNIIVAYYTDSFPAGVTAGLVMMIVVYTGFILLAAYLRRDII